MVTFYLNYPKPPHGPNWVLQQSKSSRAKPPVDREEMMVKLHKLQEEFTEMEVEGGLDHGKLWKAMESLDDLPPSCLR